MANEIKVFTVSEKLQEAVKALEDIINSDYIPFTSPSPSSTESSIKKDIFIAHDYILDALKKHNSCFTLKDL